MKNKKVKMKEPIKKARLKEIFRKKGFRINNENTEKFALLISKQINYLIEKIIRHARISGRKTIKSEDIRTIKE